MATVILLARHGETEWNREGRIQGHLDPPLNDRGREQARELAARLEREGIDTLYASDLRRALETAEIVSTALGMPLRIEERLKEIDVGSWQGLTRDEVKSRFPDAHRRWLEGEAPWNEGDTYEALAARVLPALVELAERHAEGLVVAVTHGGPVRVALRAAGGKTYSPRSIENASVVRLAVRDGQIEAVD